MIGKPRITNWFQTPVTTTASPTGRPLKPQARSIANDVAMPTAAPPGATIESADDARVTRAACRYRRPGSAAIERRRVRSEVEDGREHERDQPLPRERLDDVPDLSVVRDARQREREDAADDEDGGDDGDDPRAPRAALPVRVVELDLDELVFGVGREARFDLARGHASVSPCCWTLPSGCAEMQGVDGRVDRMSIGGRARTRGQVLRRVALVAGALVLVALLLLVTGHWVLGIIVGVVAAAAVWGYLQARSVR